MHRTTRQLRSLCFGAIDAFYLLFSGANSHEANKKTSLVKHEKALVRSLCTKLSVELAYDRFCRLKKPDRLPIKINIEMLFGRKQRFLYYTQFLMTNIYGIKFSIYQLQQNCDCLYRFSRVATGGTKPN
jgi:hypothetical protein